MELVKVNDKIQFVSKFSLTHGYGDCDKELLNLIKNADHKIVAHWVAICAEKVLKNFENFLITDSRPRQAVQAIRLWANGCESMFKCRKFAFAAHCAAREVLNKSAIYAARSAGHAAATAHVKTHAFYCANYAIKSLIENTNNQTVGLEERKWQVAELIKLIQMN